MVRGRFLSLNTNLHIDLLKSQYAVFSKIYLRMQKTRPKDEDTYQLGYELHVLRSYLITKEK